MFKSYFKAAWRNLMKNKAFSFINIFGLTIGLTSFLLIALYIFDELTFDAFHKNADAIFRVVESSTSSNGTTTKSAGAGYQLSQRAVSDFPAVKDAARIITFQRTNVATTENNNVFYENFTIANPGFLKVFDFPLLQGDRNTALTEPHSVILTAATAQKLFNTTNVLNKLIRVDRDSAPYKITAVLQNFPANSHISFNLLFSESSIGDEDFKKFINTDWNSGAFTTYLLLRNNTNSQLVQTKINQLVAANTNNDEKHTSTYLLQPLKNIHFYSAGIADSAVRKGNITYIYVFIVLAIFILFIACINYMNLTTAHFANRAKEVAVRKVAGASRRSLISQFLSEALLMSVIALVAAILLVEILLPYFNRFTEKDLTLGLSTDYRIWAGIGVVILFVGLLSGLYPALFQSASKPLVLLKSKFNPNRGTLSIRRALVVFQFTLSIIMIFSTIIVYMQLKYVNTKDMGFNKEQLLVVDINSGKVRKAAATIKNAFAQLAQVKDVAVSSRVPGEWKDLPKVKVKSENIQTPEGEDMYFLGVDDRFLKTYGISLVKGRNFAQGSVADSAAVIINQTAAKVLGIRAPSEQLIDIPLEKPFEARIIGIVKDFNFQSLREPLAPMILGFQKNLIQSIDYFTVKITMQNTPGTLKQIEAILHNIDPGHLFEYHFLDKQWELFYHEDSIRETIFFIVAILTIVIACLGLFGLASYAAEQRIKEIGIRKVLGASVSSIVAMLSKEFLKLVLIALVIAFPVAWWAMNQWLQDFAYRVTISWWVFFIAGFAALFIAILTISFKTIKSAFANPVKSLRTE